MKNICFYKTNYIFTGGDIIFDMIPVDSSDVAAIGFYNNVVQVQFLSGAVYQYFNVPKSVFDSFLSSASKGRFVHYVLSAYSYKRIC